MIMTPRRVARVNWRHPYQTPPRHATPTNFPLNTRCVRGISQYGVARIQPRNPPLQGTHMADLPRLNQVIKALESGQPAFTTFSAAEIEPAVALAQSKFDGVVYEMEHNFWDARML